MAKENVRQFIEKLYTDPEITQTWQREPKEAVKESGLRISDKELETIKTTLGRGDIITARSYQDIEAASKNMRTAFKTTLWMHSITFSLGILLILTAIAAAFLDQTVFAAITGAIGLVDIVYYFIEKPISGIHESIGNLIQLQLAHQGWMNELVYWQVFLYEGDITIKEKVAAGLQKCTQQHMFFIQKYCETKPQKENKQKKEEEES